MDAKWPGAIQLGPIEAIDEAELWRRACLEFSRVFLWLASGVFPCQDLSGLNSGWLGMKGKRSRFLSQMLRIIEGGQRFFEGRPVRVALMAENVASLDEEQLILINEMIGEGPFSDLRW